MFEKGTIRKENRAEPKPVTSYSRYWPIIFIVICIVVVIALFANKKSSETNGVPKLSYAQANGLISTDVEAFNNTYSDTTSLQRGDYITSITGKLVEWTGTITDVESGKVRVHTKSGVSFYAEFSAESTFDLASLNKDQRVTIRGKIDRHGFLADWILTDSTVIKK